MCKFKTDKVTYSELQRRTMYITLPNINLQCILNYLTFVLAFAKLKSVFMMYMI